MGQAALKYDDFDELDQVPIPAGGIATFLTAETGSWADDDDDVPPKGITNVVKIADKLAEYGRNEDEYMVHAAEGETVIPMEVFKQNPALKDKLFAEMRIMGIEPERYVVGNELNSINPVTGQPEFFLKKLFKGLKKIVKKVLPVVAKIVLTPFVGPVAASAIVDGATVLIQGGSLKDGLKAAAIGGISSFAAGKIGDTRGWAANSAKQVATEAAINTTLSGGKPRDILKSAAIAGAVSKGTEFFRSQDPSKVTVEEGVSVGQQKADASLPNQVYDDFTGQMVDVAAPAAKGPTTQVYDDFTGQMVDVSAEQAVKGSATEAVPGRATGPVPGKATQVYDPFTGQMIDVASPVAAKGPTTQVYDPFTGQMIDVAAGADTGADTGAGAGADTGTDAPSPARGLGSGVIEAPSIGKNLKTFLGLDPGPQSLGDRFTAAKNIFAPRGAFDREAVAKYLTDQKGKLITAEDPLVTKFIKESTGALRTYGPVAGAALGVSMLSQPEELEFTDLTSLPSLQSYIDADPQRFRIYDDDRTYTPSRFTITRAAGADLGAPAFQPTPINTPPLAVAEGGGIINFPRMNGPIEGPGTETSDDIPAMLSDGEFVFTAKAVRGAGKGSREDGMKNMYNMMRQFEARV
tara:strand:- start:1798 stop:3699 length:1902 start_codon:yes stop_codon:yes gene_type:complete